MAGSGVALDDNAFNTAVSHRNVMNDIIHNLHQREPDVIVTLSGIENALTTKRFGNSATMHDDTYGGAVGGELYERVFSELEAISKQLASRSGAQYSTQFATHEQAALAKIENVKSFRQRFEGAAKAYLENVQADIDKRRQKIIEIENNYVIPLQRVADESKAAAAEAPVLQTSLQQRIEKTRALIEPTLMQQETDFDKTIKSLQTQLAACGRFDLKQDQLRHQLQAEQNHAGKITAYLMRLRDICEQAGLKERPSATAPTRLSTAFQVKMEPGLKVTEDDDTRTERHTVRASEAPSTPFSGLVPLSDSFPRVSSEAFYVNQRGAHLSPLSTMSPGQHLGVSPAPDPPAAAEMLVEDDSSRDMSPADDSAIEVQTAEPVQRIVSALYGGIVHLFGRRPRSPQVDASTEEDDDEEDNRQGKMRRIN